MGSQPEVGSPDIAEHNLGSRERSPDREVLRSHHTGSGCTRPEVAQEVFGCLDDTTILDRCLQSGAEDPLDRRRSDQISECHAQCLGRRFHRGRHRHRSTQAYRFPGDCSWGQKYCRGEELSDRG